MTSTAMLPRRKWILIAGGTLSVVAVAFLGLVYFQTHLKLARVPSSSMEPTIAAGSEVWWTPISSSTQPPKRWDIVVVRVPNQPGVEVVKRVIALAGESIQIRDGSIVINGQPVEVPPDAEPLRHVAYRSDCPVYENALRIPADHFFVIGDNTRNSSDSRNFGAVERVSIIGRVLKWSSPAK